MWLVMALAVAFLVLRFGPADLTHWLVVHFAVIPQRLQLLAVAPDLVGVAILLLSFATHTLIHLDFIHVLANAGFLLAFGSVCERAFGTPRFLVLFFGTAFAGAAAQTAATLALDPQQMVVMFGASGGVAGAMGAAVRLMLQEPSRRATGLALIGVLLLVNILFIGFGGAVMGVEGQVAWEAHLAGFAAGFGLGHAWRPRPTTVWARRRWD